MIMIEMAFMNHLLNFLIYPKKQYIYSLPINSLL